MDVANAYGTGGLSNLTGLDALLGVNGKGKRGASTQTTTSSGDTVDISAEARKLFSEKIHKYDSGAPTTAVAASDGKDAASVEGLAAGESESAEAGAAGSDAAGGSGGASGSSDTESIKKQIESLKSQLMSLASQLSGGAADSGVTSKMNALQSQISALEAQLNAVEA